jgi:quercetin dioxygenase-like cupin family protein
MQKTSIGAVRRNVIEAGSDYERTVQLIASPRSRIKRDSFGCGVTTIPVGHKHESHAHPTSSELIYILSGKGTGTVGGEKIEFSKGDIIAINENEAHQFENASDEDLCMYWIYSPSGAEVRFED